MTTAEQLITECDRRNIALEHGGEKLLVTPVDRTTPELMEQLRLHKREILSVLECRKRDAALHLAKQILAGEFGGCDDATRERVTATVHSLPHLLFRAVLAKLYE